MEANMIPGAMLFGEADSSSNPNRLYYIAMVLPYVILVGLVGLLVYSCVCGEPFKVAVEDGFIEWATVTSFAVCGLVAVAAAIVKWGRLSRAQKVLIILVALVSFMAIGEELSWGQRYFDPDKSKASKLSKEGIISLGHGDTTWHNATITIGPMHFSLGGALFGLPLFIVLFIHGVWLPWRVGRGGAKSVAFVRKLGLFLPPLHLGIMLLVAAVFFHWRKRWNGVEAREFKEMLVPTVYAFILLHAYFRERRGVNVAITVAVILLMAAGFALSVVVAI